MNREQYKTGIQFIVNKSARITSNVAGNLKQYFVRIVSNGPVFELHICLMSTNYWTNLLDLDVRSLVFYILMFTAKLEFSFLFRREL